MFSNILVYLDESYDDGQLPYIASLAQHTRACMTILGHTRSAYASADPIEWHLSKIEAEIELDRMVQVLRDENIDVQGILLDASEYASPAHALAHHARLINADLLIIGSSSRGLLLDPALTGAGIAINVLGNGPSDYPEQAPIQKVMIPLDCSLRAECVLPLARHFSQLMQADVLLAHVVGCTDMPPRLQHDSHILDLVQQVVAHKKTEGQRYLNQVQSSFAGTVETRLVVNNNIRQALHEIASQGSVDLVILSARGLSGNSDWPYGSVTTSFITQSTLPLLIVPDAGVAHSHTQTWPTEIPVATRPNHVA